MTFELKNGSIWEFASARTFGEVRRKRLKDSRGYSDEKVTSIMNGQLKEEEFRKACQVVIDNSGDMEETKKQIDKLLGDRLWKVQENFLDN